MAALSPKSLGRPARASPVRGYASEMVAACDLIQGLPAADQELESLPRREDVLAVLVATREIR